MAALPLSAGTRHNKFCVCVCAGTRVPGRLCGSIPICCVLYSGSAETLRHPSVALPVRRRLRLPRLRSEQHEPGHGCRLGAQDVRAERDTHHAAHLRQSLKLGGGKAALRPDEETGRAAHAGRRQGHAPPALVTRAQRHRWFPAAQHVQQRRGFQHPRNAEPARLLGRFGGDGDEARQADSTSHAVLGYHRLKRVHAELGRLLHQHPEPRALEHAKQQRRPDRRLRRRPQLRANADLGRFPVEPVDRGLELAVGRVEQAKRPAGPDTHHCR
eukprot:scaffold36543_cov121-Isochrysis_galbana.AAC.5